MTGCTSPIGPPWVEVGFVFAGLLADGLLELGRGLPLADGFAEADVAGALAVAGGCGGTVGGVGVGVQPATSSTPAAAIMSRAVRCIRYRPPLDWRSADARRHWPLGAGSPTAGWCRDATTAGNRPSRPVRVSSPIADRCAHSRTTGLCSRRRLGCTTGSRLVRSLSGSSILSGARLLVVGTWIACPVDCHEETLVWWEKGKKCRLSTFSRSKPSSRISTIGEITGVIAAHRRQSGCW